MTPLPFLYCAGLALVVLSLAWRPWRPGPSAGAGEATREPLGTLGNAVAWAGATFLAFYAMKDRLPPFPGTEAEHYWAWAAVATLLPAVLEGRAWSVATLLGAGVFGAFVWFATEPLRGRAWEGSEIALQVGGAFALGLALCAARPGSARAWGWADGPSYPGALALATAGGAAVLGQSYGGAAHLAGGLAFVPATVAVFAMWRPGRRYWPGLASAWTLGLPTLLLTGVWFAETPWISALLVGASPQLARIPLGGRKSPRLAAIGHGVLVALAAAGAVWLALRPANPYAGY